MNSGMEMLVSVLKQIKKKRIWVLRWFYQTSCRWNILQSHSVFKSKEMHKYSWLFMFLCPIT